MKKQHGFTLVEILVVVAIIGILAAIAIPQFSRYRGTSYCASIKSDLTNLARYQEEYYLSNNTYLVVTQSGRSSNMSSFMWSPGVTLDGATADLNGWTATASHASCPGGSIVYDSTAQGLQ